MDKKVYARLDRMLYALARMERRAKSYDPRGGMNPTERSALKNLELLAHEGHFKAELEAWARVEKELRRVIRGTLVEKIYIRKYVRRQGYVKICRELYISRNTFYAAVREIRTFALACACQLGLMKVF